MEFEPRLFHDEVSTAVVDAADVGEKHGQLSSQPRNPSFYPVVKSCVNDGQGQGGSSPIQTRRNFKPNPLQCVLGS